MSDNKKKLKSIIYTETYREIEKRFIQKAKAIKDIKIDRTIPYEEQGRQTHANEMAYKAIMDVIKMMRKELEEKFKKQISWE